MCPHVAMEEFVTLDIDALNEYACYIHVTYENAVNSNETDS